MRVLVTGGTGYIGSTAVEILLSQGYEISILDDCSMGHADTVPTGVRFVQGTLLNPAEVADALTGDFANLTPNSNFEYWIYKQTTINGVARGANTPSSDNLDWTEVYKVPTASGGSVGTPFTNEGIYYVYQQNNAGNYISLGSYVGPERQDNNYRYT